MRATLKTGRHTYRSVGKRLKARRFQFLVLAPLVSLALCGNALAERVVSGLVSITQEGRASFYFVDPLPEDQDVSLHKRIVNGMPVGCCTRVSRSELKLMKTAPADVTGGGGRPVAAYVLDKTLPGNWGEDGLVAVAMSAPSTFQNGSYSLLGRDPKSWTRARMCYGAEGVNLVATTGSTVRSLYLSFGYEIDASPKCNAWDERDLGKVKL